MSNERTDGVRVADVPEEEARAADERSSVLKREVAARLFAELVWPVPRVLAWIAFREEACIEENWRAAKWYPPQAAWPPRDGDPQGTLVCALQDGSLRALRDGSEIPREAWANATGLSWPDDVRFDREDVLALWPVERERLLALARAAGSLEPVRQRNAVKGLIRDSLWSRTCTPMEILEGAYGDPQGHRYWELWLFEPLRLYPFADLLAVHCAATKGVPVASIVGMSVPVFDGHLRQIFERLRAAAEAGETWLIGDASSLLRETWPSLVLRNSAVTVRPREAIAWLYRNPNARHLVPATPAQMAGSFRDDLVAAEQPSVQGTEAVSKSNRDDGGTPLTVRGETEAIAALASQFGKTLDQTKRADALAWLRSEDFKLSDRGFFTRVWPAARVRAGLKATALPGAKKKN